MTHRPDPNPSSGTRRLAPLASLALATLLLLGTWGSASAGLDPYDHFFETTFGDFQEELEITREEDKKALLIFFEMDECPFCHRMKETVLNRREVQEFYREHFRILSVDVNGDVEVVHFDGQPMRQADFAFRENRVRATPVFQFYNHDGEPIVRFTGATSGVEEFMWLGEFVAEGHYKETNFNRYKRDRQAQARQ
ncbi:thioredoxin [Thioalkalivibrio denitrificans]|uniref:Thioredoxin n=1 Tax=Thioalkalivibrio denitrificans TaxID=108003 RepID=A0A1V3NDV6_9GAMM|nr:thioredoxin family protein [Thioalkalivibrio denitrificans]OOG23215.1 thioredoxin [Thioalkalivibrio denitrificans]